MEDHNAQIIYKCFSNELDYIYGLYAIKRELKEREVIKKCELCNRAYFTRRTIYINHNSNWCDKCNDPNFTQQHMKFNYHKILTYTNKTNYFDYVPDEIISLIFDNLSEYEVMNFYIAIQKCDRENFKKIAYWAKMRCVACKYIKTKYLHCFQCNTRLCFDCTKKCTYCDNRIWYPKFTKDDVQIDDIHYLGDYDDYRIDKKDTCLDEWSMCSDTHMYVEYYNEKFSISDKEYLWNFKCEICKEDICLNCTEETGHYNFQCTGCHLHKRLSLEEWPLLK